MNSTFTTHVRICKFCIVIVVYLPSSPSAGLLIAEMTTMVVMSMAGVLIAAVIGNRTAFSPQFIKIFVYGLRSTYECM